MDQAPSALVSSRLIAATSHPTRLKALTALIEDGERTPAQIAAAIDEPVNNVNYHVKILVELGCAELTRVQPSGGGRVSENVYRATQRVLLINEWEGLSEAERLQFDTALIQMISDDLATAMAHGTYFEDDDSHVSRMPMKLDQAGWDEVVTLLAGTLERLMSIQEQVDERTGGPEERPHHARVNILHYRSPRPKAP